MNKDPISVLDIAKGIRLPRFKRLQFAFAVLASSIVFAPMALIPVFMLIRLGAYRYQKDSYMGARYLQTVATCYMIMSLAVFAIAGWKVTLWLVIPKLYLAFSLHRAMYNFYRITSRQSNIGFARDAHLYMVSHGEQDLVESALLRKR